MPENSFDKAAWYLLSYSGTLSLDVWRDAVVQLYSELEASYGPSQAQKLLNKVVAYYCMEIGQSYQGRKAIAKFRQIHKWADFKNSDNWWREEWLARREFDFRVQEIRAKLIAEPSVPPEDIHHDSLGREALSVLMDEARRRHGEYVTDDLEEVFRILISIYGGHAILSLWHDGILTDYRRVTTLLSSYFIERELVATYGNALVNMKQREYE